MVGTLRFAPPYDFGSFASNSACPSMSGSQALSTMLTRCVIASAAKQSMSPNKERMDCFAALAMTLEEPLYLIRRDQLPLLGIARPSLRDQPLQLRNAGAAIGA